MTKSIHIIGSRLLGGAESFYMRLVRALHEQGPTLAVNRSDSLVARELAGDVEQFHTAMSSQWDLLSRRRISRLIQQQRPDIVQTYMTRATVLTHIKPGRGTVHVARLGGFYKIRRFAHAHAWVGNTHGICDYLVRGGLPAERVFYIGNFVDRPAPVEPSQQCQLRRQLGLPDDALVVVALGRMVAKKGFQDLLPAFARVAPTVHDRPVHLLLVGDGPLRAELERQAHDLGLDERVHWAGWQTDTSPYYYLADLFVCPSRHEPLGNVILEAWSHRLPVLSTASHGAVELIEDGVNGVLTSCEDIPALAEQLVLLLRAGANTLEPLAHQGYASIEAAYRPEAVVRAYAELYQQLSVP
jgi:glycosyltransferase involved in cell wall biosynthesis